MRLRMPFPGFRMVTANAPEVVQEVFLENARHFDKSDMLRFSLAQAGGRGAVHVQRRSVEAAAQADAPLFHAQGPGGVRGRHGRVHAPHRGGLGRRRAAPAREGDDAPHHGIAGKTLFDADTFSEADEIGRALTVALEWTGWAVGRPFSIAHVVAKTRRGQARRAHHRPRARPARAREHRLGGRSPSSIDAAASWAGAAVPVPG